MLSLISTLLILSRLSSCTEILQQSNNIKYPWTVSFVVSEQPASQIYLGQIQFFLLFDDGHREHLATSNTLFASGMNQKYNIQLPTQSRLRYMVVRTTGMCLKPILINRVEVALQTTGKTYSKSLNGTAVVDKCQQLLGTQIIDFQEELEDQKFCTVNGRRYENGEHFVIGCEASCQCANGHYTCVDLCPATAVRSKTPCQQVKIVGQCCPAYRCEQADQPDQTAVDNCDQQKGQTKTPETNYGYPSTVYICNNKECTDERVGAVLLSNSWVMAPLVDNWNVSETRVFIARPTEKGIYRYGVDRMIVNENASLTLLKINDFAPNTLTVQSANLPLSSRACADMMSSRRQCSPFAKVGWNFDVNVDVAQPNLSIIDGVRLADVNDCPPTKPNMNTICLTANVTSASLCPPANGGPVYLQYDRDVQYLVAMQIWRSKQLTNNCRPELAVQQAEPAISICPHLDWIRKVLNHPVSIQ